MDYQKLMEFRNKNNNFAKLLGIEITKISEGYAEAEMKITDQFKNPIGSVHGGCLFTIADAVGCSAASSYGFHITTINSDFHYLNAGLNTEKIYASAVKIKHGKKIAVYNVSVKDENNLLLAEGIFTFMSLGKAIEI